MRYINSVFPQIKIDRIHLGINEANIFRYNPPAQKERVIAYMPRKNADHIKRVLPLLYQIPAVKSGAWVLKPFQLVSYS
jgi:hypothetical protein